MWPAIIAGNEAEVEPSPEWHRKILAEIRLVDHPLDQFICLLRGDEDQLNVLAVDGAFVLDWYRGDMGGHVVGFRKGQAPAQLPREPGFLARLLGASRPPIQGSRISLEEAARVLDAYIEGAWDFPAFEWKRRNK